MFSCADELCLNFPSKTCICDGFCLQGSDNVHVHWAWGRLDPVVEGSIEAGGAVRRPHGVLAII